MNSGHVMHRTIITVLGYVFLLPVALMAERIYTVNGRVQSENFGPRKFRHEYDFTVTVSNCLWACEMRGTKGEQVRQFFDGKLLTGITVHNTNNTMYVEENDIPTFLLAGPAPVVWLAYASSCQFEGREGRSEGFLKYIWFLEPVKRTAKLQTAARWELNDDYPFLPKWVDYYYDEGVWNGEACSDRVLSRALKAGILILRLEAKDFRGFDSISIPWSFVFSGYTPEHQLAHGGQPRKSYQITGTLDSFSPTLEARLFNSTATGKAIVDDQRFITTHRVTGITYAITNTSPPPSTDKRLGFLVARKDRLEQASSKHAPFGAWIFIGLGAVTMVLILRSWLHNLNKGGPQSRKE